jgi:hypothetical protein
MQTSPEPVGPIVWSDGEAAKVYTLSGIRDGDPKARQLGLREDEREVFQIRAPHIASALLGAASVGYGNLRVEAVQ